MRRLAIIDVPGSNQPLTNEDETTWVVFNGEIYNYREVRTKLVGRGHTFRTNGDTECIPHAYEEFGDDCVKHFQGQFAFALWDVAEKKLLLARDRFGEKPLFYTIQGHSLYFASELSAIYAVLDQRPNISLAAIDTYLALQYIPEPMTACEGIFKLPAGHYLTWQNALLRMEKYWDLEYLPKLTGTAQELAGELVERTRASVTQAMISDVPIGAHLSGGIDSSIIVALMAESGHGQIKTFSAGFVEESFSELKYAQLVANRYGTDHYEFILEYQDIPETLSDILEHVGEPLADSSMLPLYHLCRLTRRHVAVALNGDGGDETFGGYLRYMLDPWANLYLHTPSLAQKIISLSVRPFGDSADKPIGASVVNGLKRLEQLAATDKRASILRWGSYFSAMQRKKLWAIDPWRSMDNDPAEELLVHCFENANATSFLDKTMYTDIKTYLPGALLVKSDRMAMAHSLEGRSPFLNHELAEWAARLPENIKIRGRTGKYLLRQAFSSYLPKEILNRSKRGFGVPVGAWLRKPLAGWSRDLLLCGNSTFSQWFRQSSLEQLLAEHQSGREDHGRRIWALVVLAMWLQQMDQKW